MRRILTKRVLENLGVAEDCCEQVVEVMSHSTGEWAQGVHPLLPTPLLLDLASLADIGEVHIKMLDLTLDVELGNVEVRKQTDCRAVLPAHSDLEVLGAAALADLHDDFLSSLRVGGQGPEIGLFGLLLGSQPEHSQRSWIARDNASGGVDPHPASDLVHYASLHHWPLGAVHGQARISSRLGRSIHSF